MSRLRTLRRVPAPLALAFAVVAPLALAPAATADDASDAAQVAGLLRSADPVERIKGETLLLERTRAGGDLPAFLRALAEALGPGATPPPSPVNVATELVYDVRDLLDAGHHVDPLSWRMRQVAAKADIAVRGTTILVRAFQSDHIAITKMLEALRRERTLRIEPPPAPPPPMPDGPRVSVLARVHEMKAAEAAPLLGDARDRVRLLDEQAASELEQRLAGRPDPWTATIVTAVGNEAWSYRSPSLVSYRKDVTRAADGTWKVVPGEISEGRRIAFAPTVADGRLRMSLRLSDTTVARPIPTTTVKPTADAAPVEIDAPQWATVAATADLDLPAPSGTALVHLPGLDLFVVLRYRVEPAAPAR